MASGYWSRRQDVSIGSTGMPGVLAIPERARGLVVFADGSGISRNCRRNTLMAAELHGRGFATLILDLLSKNEVHSRNHVFDIDLLASRLVDAVNWAVSNTRTSNLPIGLLGAGAGAAAALAAAAERPDTVRAVVSHRGRPDLTGREIGHVRAPTLLIASDTNRHTLKLNEAAYHKLTCLRELTVIRRAACSAEKNGTLKAAVRVATQWFDLYLISRSAVAASAAGAVGRAAPAGASERKRKGSVK